MSVGREWTGSFMGSVSVQPSGPDSVGPSSALSPGRHHAFSRQPEPGGLESESCWKEQLGFSLGATATNSMF